MAEEEQKQEQKPSDEEIARQLEEELRKIKISELLLQTLYTVTSLGYRKLGPEDRDLPEAKLSIEALRALLLVLKDTVPDEVTRDFSQVLANMQLAYAKAVSEEEKPADADG